MASGKWRLLLLIAFVALCSTTMFLGWQVNDEPAPTVPLFTEDPQDLEILKELDLEKKERARLQDLVSQLARQVEASKTEKAGLSQQIDAVRSEKEALSRQVNEIKGVAQQAVEQLAESRRLRRDQEFHKNDPPHSPPPPPTQPNGAQAKASTLSPTSVSTVLSSRSPEPTAQSSPASSVSLPPDKVTHTTPAAWGSILNNPIPPLGHRLAVIVPYRDVYRELQSFVPHMHKFLREQAIDFRIFVVNQTDDWRFNRAQLINVGYLLASQSCDYLVMHDVDLLPLNKNLSYRFPIRPMHLASPKFHPKYHYPNFIGGVFVISNADFLHVNGLSNKFWGWGREDDDFFIRLKRAGISINRPENFTEITTGKNDTFLHLHDPEERPRDFKKLFNQRTVGKLQDTVTGVATAEHVITKVAVDHVQTGEDFIRVEVNLTCNQTFTPWCEMYKECGPHYYRMKPMHKVCSVCTWRCWTGFVLVGHCTENTSPKCLKVGRDISVEEAKKWPKGTIAH